MPTLEAQTDPDLFAPNEGGQAAFMNDITHRYCALAGGWWAGKTWAGARKHATLHFWNAFNDEDQPTYAKSFVIAQNYSLGRTICIPELRQAFDEMGVSHRFVSDPKRYCFELPDFGTRERPSEILIRSADSPETITAFSAPLAWGDEVARWPTNEDPVKDALTQLKGRLRSPVPVRIVQANFTFTHEGDLTSVYRDFEESPKPDHVLYRAGTFENPTAVTSGFVESTRAQLSADLAEQYLGGKAITLRGNAMYPPFDKAVHVRGDVKLNDDLPLQVSIDFNFRPGMHLVVGQYDERADVFIARHLIHQPQMTVPRMIAALKELIDRQYGGWKWPGALQVFGDENGGRVHSAERGETKWAVVAEYLNAMGIPFTFRKHSNNPFVSDRVNAVNAALRDARDQVHYLIHPDCDRLIDDLRLQKWTQEGETDKADEQRSHSCLVAGTMVETVNGPVPIEDIQVGDLVLTRQGYQRVSHAWMSSPDAEVMTLRTSDGRELTATGNHPIWLKDTGFIWMQDVKDGSLLECIQYPTASRANGGNLSPTTARNTSDTSTLPAESFASTSAAMSRSERRFAFTSRFGRIITGLCRKAITFTTRTKTPSTTTSTTLNASPVQNTPDCINSSPSDLRYRGRTSRRRRLLRRYGDILRRVASGFESTLSAPALAITPSNGNASTAASLSLIGRGGNAFSSAPKHARPRRGVSPESITKQESALCVARLSLSTSIGETSAAPVHVERVIRGGERKPVYDLTVEVAHEFYANGILVSNSEAEGYRIHYLRPVRKIRAVAAMPIMMGA